MIIKVGEYTVNMSYVASISNPNGGEAYKFYTVTLSSGIAMVINDAETSCEWLIEQWKRAVEPASYMSFGDGK